VVVVSPLATAQAGEKGLCIAGAGASMLHGSRG
jgi:hypothetical protein